VNLCQVEQRAATSEYVEAVELLADHRTLRFYMFKLRLTQRQDCRLCGNEKEGIAHIVRMSLLGTGMRKIQKLGSYVLDV
jgi:hypothetical protein